MKKVFSILFIVLFFLLCTLPVLLMPLLKDDSSAEKRELAAMPTLWITEEGKDGEETKKTLNTAYPSEFEAYLSDHFAFRSQLVTLDSLIKNHVFATSSTEKVVVGRDGWLFYGETIGDYTGTFSLSDTALRRIVTTLSLMNESVTAKGGQFLFFSAPNKNTLYGQYMPSRYLKAESSSLSRLHAMLSEKQTVPYLDLVSLFSSDERILYHKRDTHWNNQGAVLALKTALKQVGKTPLFDDADSFTVQKIWEGDLDGMLFPTLGNLDDQIVYDKPFTYQTRGRFRSVEDLTIQTVCESRTDSLFLFRDSFGNALMPFVGETFAYATLSRAVPYRFDSIPEETDYVFFEIVERNLKNILAYPPVIEAPVREDIPTAMSLMDFSIPVTVKKEYGMIHLSGNAAWIPDAEAYYLLFADGTVREACPMNDCDFSAYLPSDLYEDLLTLSHLPSLIAKTETGYCFTPLCLETVPNEQK